MTLCPKCGERPSRREMSYRGKTPHCRECFTGARREYDAARRRAMGAPPRVLNPLPKHKRGYELKDIPAAEIERRFTKALADIRKQRRETLWTWGQRS